MNLKKLIFAAVEIFALAAAFSLDAKVVSVKGKVERQEGSTWVALKAGESIEKSAVISTGYNSEAVFEVKGSRFTLKALSRLTVESLVSSGSTDSTQLFLDAGKVSASVSGTDGKRAGFRVRSPVAVASVRGTSFEMSAGGRLTVSEGLVSFAPATSTPSASPDGADGHAGVFDSTADVAGEYGVPVAAGQQSAFDSGTGTFSRPADEMARSVILSGMTDPLSSKEGVGGSFASNSNLPLKGAVEVNVTVKFKED